MPNSNDTIPVGEIARGATQPGTFETCPTDTKPFVTILPTWLLAPILAWLIAVNAVIVLFAWWLVQPAPVVVAEPDVVREERPKPAPIPTARILVPARGEKQRRTDDAWVEDAPRQEPARLSRRMPSFAEPPMPLLDAVAPAPKAPSVKTPPVMAPIQWTKAPPSPGAANVMMPLEMATIADAKIPFRLRRLQLAKETPKRLKLAVSPVAHDDLGSLLKKMGDGYEFVNLRREEIRSLRALQKHDVVFLTCSDLYTEDFQAIGPLRRFVEQGGTLYASDLYGDLVSAAFPEFRTRAPMLPGVPQRVEAAVEDSGMHAFLGWSVIPLHFEAQDWRPAPFDPAKVTVCLRGEYRNNLGQTKNAPLLVKFRCKKGTVIFTSFHHTKNDSATVKKVLDYLIFASLSARSEARLRDLMKQSGFTAADLRPAKLSPGQALEGTHIHKGGALQIALGFEHAGAKLRLSVRSPSGQVLEHQDEGVYQIDIPAADPGAWRWTVTPIALPHDDFPVVVAAASATK